MMKVNELPLEERYAVLRWAYSMGEPLVSDSEYTIIHNAFVHMHPESPYAQRSWSSDPCPIEALQKIGRDDLVQTVVLSDKTYSIPSLGSEYELRNALSQIYREGTLSYKHDGWNVQANYFNGVLVSFESRGRSTDATIDISILKHKLPQTIKYMGSVKIALELTMPKANFPIMFQKFSNVDERNSVRTALANGEYAELLDMHALEIQGLPDDIGCSKFEILKELGFKVPEYRYVTTFDSLVVAMNELSDLNEEYASPTDGVVYDGETKNAIRLLAWEEPIFKSYVIGYTENVKAHRISPSADIRPVFRKGVTQRHVPMTNWKRIIDNDMQIGSPIAFKIRSDATAMFLVDETKLLHEEYAGRYEEYRKMIDENEEIAVVSYKTKMRRMLDDYTNATNY